MEAPRDPGRAAAVAVAGRAAAATCGVLFVALAAFVLWRSAALLALVYVAAVIAIVLDRPVAALVRRGLGRTWALALVLSGVVAVTLAAVVVAFGPLVAQASGLATAAPAVADRVRAALVGWFGGILDGTPLAPWLHDALSRGAAALAGGVYGAAGGVANAAGAFATALLLAVLLLASGPDLVRRAIGSLPPLPRSWAEALARHLSISLGGYLAGLSTIVVARILATGAFLAVARVPFVIPLALLAGASVLIPYLGSALRLLAIGAVAWATRGSGRAVAALARRSARGASGWALRRLGWRPGRAFLPSRYPCTRHRPSGGALFRRWLPFRRRRASMSARLQTRADRAEDYAVNAIVIAAIDADEAEDAVLDAVAARIDVAAAASP
jgi:putative heme transporter